MSTAERAGGRNTGMREAARGIRETFFHCLQQHGEKTEESLGVAQGKVKRQRPRVSAEEIHPGFLEIQFLSSTGTEAQQVGSRITDTVDFPDFRKRQDQEEWLQTGRE